MARKYTRLESEGAEFLVLGQLLIERIEAYKAYTNTRDYDLVATSPETGRAARIQVKSRWATNAPHFLIRNVDKCDFVVLVRLNRGLSERDSLKRALPPEEPEYYVLTAKEAENLIVDRGTRWDKIRWQGQNFEAHRRKWDHIKAFLNMPRMEIGSR